MAVTIGLLLYAGVIIVRAVESRLSQEPFIPQVRERSFAVNVVSASPETVAPVLTAFGEILSRRELDLRASAPGPVIWLSPNFTEGGLVEQGEVLVRVDPTQAQAALDRAATDLSDAMAEQRDAERARLIARDTLAAAEEQAALRQKALVRQEQLAERNVGSAAAREEAELSASSARQAVLSARNALAQAEARIDNAATALRRAEIALTEAERDLGDTEIVAGFDGALAGVSVTEGRLVTENEVLAALIDPEELDLAFRVSASQYARLLSDDGNLQPLPVEARLDLFETDLTAHGHISRSSASVGEGQTGRLIFAELDAARGLKPGDFVTVFVEEELLADVVRLPATAVDAAGDVLVIGDDDRLMELAVTVVRRQGDDVLVTGDGLEGRDVVAERTPLLGAGILARPLRPLGQEAAAAPQAMAPEEHAPSADPVLVELTSEHRARLMAYVEQNAGMPGEMKARLLGQLEQAMVPASMVEQLESRMGG